MTFRFAIVALLTLNPVAGLSAQWSPDLRVGVRVRVLLPEREFQEMRSPGQMVRGTVARLAPDTLFLGLGDSIATIAIPRMHIRRLYVSRGVPSRGASAVRSGLFWGIGLGLVMVINPQGEPANRSHAGDVAVGAGVGFAFGGVFGAIFPLERWKRLRLEPGVAAGPTGSLGVGVKLSW